MTRRLIQQVQVRFGRTQYEGIRRAAELEGLSISGFIREAAVLVASFVLLRHNEAWDGVFEAMRKAVSRDEHTHLEEALRAIERIERVENSINESP